MVSTRPRRSKRTGLSENESTDIEYKTGDYPSPKRLPVWIIILGGVIGIFVLCFILFKSNRSNTSTEDTSNLGNGAGESIAKRHPEAPHCKDLPEAKKFRGSDFGAVVQVMGDEDVSWYYTARINLG